MQASSPKQHLPSLLKTLMMRRSAFFLQKLILYQADCDTDQHIRHYDYDCEAIEILAGFFKKKHQAILVKAFNNIKIAPLLPNNNTLSTTERKRWNGTTRRTNLNSTFTPSEGTPIKHAGLTTIRSKENDQNRLHRSGPREGSNKLHQLLSRVKAVNLSNACDTDRMRTDNGPNRDNATYCLGNSHSRYISNISCGGERNANYYGFYDGQHSSKHSRRQFIMQKFNRIESDINELQDESSSEIGKGIRDEINFLRQKLTTRAIRRSAKA